MEFVSEGIVVATVAVMQETANGAEKANGVGGQFLFDGAVLEAVFLAISDLAEPGCGLVVAQATGRVFDVRLQMINCVAITGVSLFGELGKFREHEGTRLFFGTNEDLFGETVEEFFIAR